MGAAKKIKPELKQSNTIKWIERVVLVINLLSTGATSKGILSINTKMIPHITKQPDLVLSLSDRFVKLLPL
jgi:hypothetical protein